MTSFKCRNPSSDFVYDSVAYDPVKTRLSEFLAEAEEPTNHKAWNRALLLVYSDSVSLTLARSYHSCDSGYGGELQ